MQANAAGRVVSPVASIDASTAVADRVSMTHQLDAGAAGAALPGYVFWVPQKNLAASTTNNQTVIGEGVVAARYPVGKRFVGTQRNAHPSTRLIAALTACDQAQIGQVIAGIGGNADSPCAATIERVFSAVATCAAHNDVRIDQSAAVAKFDPGTTATGWVATRSNKVYAAHAAVNVAVVGEVAVSPHHGTNAAIAATAAGAAEAAEAAYDKAVVGEHATRAKRNRVAATAAGAGPAGAAGPTVHGIICFVGQRIVVVEIHGLTADPAQCRTASAGPTKDRYRAFYGVAGWDYVGSTAAFVEGVAAGVTIAAAVGTGATLFGSESGHAIPLVDEALRTAERSVRRR